MVQTTLLFGATGLTGKHVLDAALEAGDHVIAFLRNPSKVPDAIRSKITIIEGDLLDHDKVTQAVRDSRPDAIVVACSNPPGSPEGDLNIKVVPWIVEELRKEHRLAHTRLVYLSGFLAFPPDIPTPPGIMDMIEPGGPIHAFRASVLNNIKVTAYLYEEASRDEHLHFAIVRMAMVNEAASKGKLKISENPAESITFRDMGVFLVELSHDLGAANRKAVVVDY